MKNFALYFLLATALFSSHIFAQENSPAPTRSDVILLKQKISDLETKLAKLEAQYKYAVDADMKMLAQLRQENRALKVQLRTMKKAQSAEDRDVDDPKEQRRAARRAAVNLTSDESRESLEAAREKAKEAAAESEKAAAQIRVSAQKTEKSNSIQTQQIQQIPAKKSDENLEKIDNANSEKKSGSLWDNMFPF